MDDYSDDWYWSAEADSASFGPVAPPSRLSTRRLLASGLPLSRLLSALKSQPDGCTLEELATEANVRIGLAAEYVASLTIDGLVLRIRGDHLESFKLSSAGLALVRDQ